MKIRQFHNERGLTLVELLASLSLFAVVIVLASNVIMQMMGNEEKTSDQISLRQDTNVLISELRGQYYDDKSKLCFDEGEKKFSIKEYKILSGDKSLAINDGCIASDEKSPLSQKPLFIKLTTSNASSQDISVQTTWDNKEAYVLALTLKDNDYFKDKKDFDDLIEEGANSFEVIKTLPNDDGESFIFDNNTKFDMSGVGDWEFQQIVVKENAWFPENFTLNGAYLEIEKNFYAESFYILHNDAEIHIKGGARFNDKLNPTGENNIMVDGYFFAVGEVLLYNNATITIGKDATFEDKVELQTTASITINGNATFQNPLNLHNDAKVIIEGDAQFNGSVGYDWSQGTICVKGDATFNSTVGSNLDIKENADSCN